LSRFGKPLSAEVLRKAEEAEKVKVAKTAEAAALAKAQRKPAGKRTKKKRKVETTTKVISYVSLEVWRKRELTFQREKGFTCPTTRFELQLQLQCPTTGY
jgi:hypothetical protein